MSQEHSPQEHSVQEQAHGGEATESVPLRQRFINEIKRSEPVELAFAFGMAQAMTLALGQSSRERGSIEASRLAGHGPGPLLDVVTAVERRLTMAIDDTETELRTSSRRARIAAVAIGSALGLGAVLMIGVGLELLPPVVLVLGFFAAFALLVGGTVQYFRIRGIQDRLRTKVDGLRNAARHAQQASRKAFDNAVAQALGSPSSNHAGFQPLEQMQILGDQLFSRVGSADGGEVARAAKVVQERHPEASVSAAELSVAVIELELAPELAVGNGVERTTPFSTQIRRTAGAGGTHRFRAHAARSRPEPNDPEGANVKENGPFDSEALVSKAAVD